MEGFEGQGKEMALDMGVCWETVEARDARKGIMLSEQQQTIVVAQLHPKRFLVSAPTPACRKTSLLQMPTSHGKIYYEPDVADDIDEEDPDDDLDV